MEFTGTPASTVSGSIWEVKQKELVTEGEVYTVTAEGFLERGADVQRRDQLVADGQRYEVLTVTSGHDHRGSMSHVGVALRDTRAF